MRLFDYIETTIAFFFQFNNYCTIININVNFIPDKSSFCTNRSQANANEHFAKNQTSSKGKVFTKNRPDFKPYEDVDNLVVANGKIMFKLKTIF